MMRGPAPAAGDGRPPAQWQLRVAACSCAVAASSPLPKAPAPGDPGDVADRYRRLAVCAVRPGAAIPANPASSINEPDLRCGRSCPAVVSLA